MARRRRGARGDAYGRLWFAEVLDPDEITFESDVFLLTKEKALALRQPSKGDAGRDPAPADDSRPGLFPPPEASAPPVDSSPGEKKTVRLTGAVPSEVWNKLGTRVIPKLRKGDALSLNIDVSISINAADAGDMADELRQILNGLGLSDRVHVEY